MSVTADDLGPLASLATAIGLLQDGEPNPGWLGDPGASLATVLADDAQRQALIDFVDEAMGGAEQDADAAGTTWLPLVTLQDPPLTVAATVDEAPSDHVVVGLGVTFSTSAPASQSSLSLPLFRAAKRGGTVDDPFVLGTPGGRLRFSTRVTVDAAPPVPGQARLGAIGLDVDVPTGPGDAPAAFGVALEGFQLPGASSPRTLRLSAASADELDDAVLDLVLSLVRAQAEAAGLPALSAVAGLLGLAGDAVPAFPVDRLAADGPQALAAWLEELLAGAGSRQAWLDHLAGLLGGVRDGDEVAVTLGAIGADVRLGLRTGTGASGHVEVTATLGVDAGGPSPRVQARADVVRLDLGSGRAVALPSLGLWASVGRHDGAGARVLDVAAPRVVQADRLRLGFALDAARHLTFVLAADGVLIGTRPYATLDLSSPDAVMDAVGNAVEDVAEELLGQLASALGTARVLLGLDAPDGHPGVPTISLADLLRDPLGAVAGHWRTLLSAHADAVPTVLGVVRDAVADAGAAAGNVLGTGTTDDPWRVPLLGPLGLEVAVAGDVLGIAAAVRTRVDTLGQRCTVVETRLAATVASIDLAARRAELLPAVDAGLTARERGVDPPRVSLVLGEDVEVSASHVGLALTWSARTGLSARLDAPSLALSLSGEELPIALPTIGADGGVALPDEAWDVVQALAGLLGELLPGLPGDAVRLLGWTAETDEDDPVLRLAALVADPAAALAAWLPAVLLHEVGAAALGALADVLTAAGPVSGALDGTGHPDDPYRLALDLDAGVPALAVWFPPAGLEPRVVAAPEALRRWRPGDPPLPPDALADALRAEAAVAADVHDLVAGRDLAGGLAELVARWTGGDGRIVPPATPPDGVDVDRVRLAAGQLHAWLDLDDELGRAPTTVVHVAVGTAAWPDAPDGRRVDLTAPGLAPEMLTAPAPATGEWFVALGERAACRLASGDDDGTVGQAARLRRVLDALAPLGNDLVVVGVAGAGHPVRLAAQDVAAVADAVTVGTPLGPVSLTALTAQPAADAIRLLGRLLPPVDPDAPEDADLALGRALVAAMLELGDRADPAAELRPPATALPAPRAGLTTTAVLGAVEADQVGRAITAVVAAGLATRARARAATPPPPATGVRGGVRLVVPPSTTGALAIEGDALLTLAGYDREGGVRPGRELRVRLTVRDRLGWLVATPELGLRMVTADVTIPIGAPGAGQATLTLHDARALGVDAERLVVGTASGAVPLLPEARLLLGVAVERLVAEGADPLTGPLVALLESLGLVVAGGAVPSAFEQLVHDPGGLVAARLAAARAALQAALVGLLGPAASAVDLEARTLTLHAGGPDHGPWGWDGRLTAGPAGVSGRLALGPDPATAGAAGALQLVAAAPALAASLHWRLPGGGETVALWPAPDGQAIARLVARAAPSLAGHVALELMRRADEEARPVVDAALDALGALGGAVGDADRPLRPLAGLLADPAGWLRSADSIGSQPAKAQALLDALRPLTGLGGTPGAPLAIADGVALSVRAEGPDLHVELAVDTAGWAPAATPLGRLAAGLTAGLTISAAGPVRAGLAVHAGLAGAAPGRSAVHVVLADGVQVFLRPGTGADVPLLPFAGLGGLAAAAERALPFLLDQLADAAAPVGPAVSGVGDALALRTGAPAAFDADRLAGWAHDPPAALAAAVPSIVATGLATLEPLVDDLLPAAVSVTSAAGSLTVAVGGVSLAWDPAAHRVTVSGDGLDVPGLEAVGFTVALDDVGLAELAVTVGPAAIDAGSLTLRPFASVAAGATPAGGRRVAVGLAVDDTHRFGARWLLDGGGFALIAGDGPIAASLDDPDPVVVALRGVEAVADLVGAVALGTTAVQSLLDEPVGAEHVRDLVRGVLLEDAAAPAHLLPGVFDPSTALDRAQRLLRNLAGAALTVTVDGLTLSLLEEDGTIGVQLGLTGRKELVPGDVTLWLETDDSWIEDNPPGSGGLFLGLLPAAGGLRFDPSLTVNGVGIRVGKKSGPLLDLGITVESIALYAFARLDTGGARAGGLALAFANLAVSAAGATGGNGIASGILRDSGTPPPKPAFSPSLAIQKHGGEPLHVTLRAGDGDGPWWIAIQKGFGPLYLEQVGLGVTMPQQRIERISLLMDGSVSLFGLTCAVDDLEITYLVTRGDPFTSGNWDVDLAGLAVSADMAGVSIAGGLLKSGTPPSVEYLGMLLGRFGVYGITIFGGYGETVAGGERFTSFFAVGAVVGPIGGPPAFFLTGIGGGFGINRQLVVPTDLSRFGEYPLIQALDVAASPGNPMDQLRALGTVFPPERGTFWFAAGISFTSFALVDGIAVVAVEIGDGLDISLLGLARMALPRPQVALVSIEIALVVRFSSSEGVIWVQGQLTDNSWLLYSDVRLTGGFAFVTWFKGPYRGQFVLTMGGYHPDFNKPGYPEVPRLGLRWGIGDAIVIKAGAYFALTSEAVMAGGDFEASATFGPAWAEVKFGAHGIVYYDPFRYKVSAYARIGAGVTIDTWLFGEITFSIHKGCTIEVEGPEFHGRVTFDVGPVELTVEFGDRSQTSPDHIGAGPFIQKYLTQGASGGARAIAVIVSGGAQPSGGGVPTPDGGSDRPFVVVAEFSLVLTTLVPATDVNRHGQGAAVLPSHHAPSRALGVAPMGTGSMASALELAWRRDGAALGFPFSATGRPYGAFPVGVWGPPGDDDNRATPSGDVIEALSEVDLVARAVESPGGPQIPYYQVEIGPRKPLPFTRRTADETLLRDEGSALAALVPEPASVDSAFATAERWLAATASPTALAALRGERQAPPRFGTLGEGLDARAASVVPSVGQTPVRPPVDTFVHPPRAVGVLSAAGLADAAAPPRGTTVSDSARLLRTPAPTMASIDPTRTAAMAAQLVVAAPRAAGSTVTKTLVAAGAVPPTGVSRVAPAVVARPGGDGRDRLLGLDASLTAGRRVPAAAGTPAATLAGGEVAVLRMPNAARDVGDGARPQLAVRGGPVRVVALANGGDVTADQDLGLAEREPVFTVPQGTERLAVLALGDGAGPEAGLAGWHAGMLLPYVGWSTALGARCTIRSRGGAVPRHRERGRAGWVAGAELAAGRTTVATRFSIPVGAIVVVLDDPDAIGGEVPGRRLVLGLDGALRATDGTAERSPVVVTAESRSVLAYDVVSQGDGPVTVTVASDPGWSLAAVFGAPDGTTAEAAAGVIAAQGLDGALRPLVPGRGGGTRLVWLGDAPPTGARRARTHRPRKRGR